MAKELSNKTIERLEKLHAYIDSFKGEWVPLEDINRNVDIRYRRNSLHHLITRGMIEKRERVSRSIPKAYRTVQQ